MRNQVDITPAGPEYREAIISLLRSAGLPVEDLPQQLQNFFTATDNGFVVGVIGLETYDRNGLLRSLVVKPEYQKLKIAAALVSKVENLGRSLGLDSIYLLTETAKDYFGRKGYEQIVRTQAPESLNQSTEFSHVCPGTAILMKKTISPQ
jgi:amino-acid N-acetyltransferase